MAIGKVCHSAQLKDRVHCSPYVLKKIAKPAYSTVVDLSVALQIFLGEDREVEMLDMT